MNVNAFEFVYQNVEFIDGNNHFPEPGENGQGKNLRDLETGIL